MKLDKSKAKLIGLKLAQLRKARQSPLSQPQPLPPSQPQPKKEKKDA